MKRLAGCIGVLFGLMMIFGSTAEKHNFVVNTKQGFVHGMYRIKKGDTLSEIAQSYEITVKNIMKHNPDIVDPDIIFIDNYLTLPPDVIEQPTIIKSSETPGTSEIKEYLPDTASIPESVFVPKPVQPKSVPVPSACKPISTLGRTCAFWQKKYPMVWPVVTLILAIAGIVYYQRKSRKKKGILAQALEKSRKEPK